MTTPTEQFIVVQMGGEIESLNREIDMACQKLGKADETIASLKAELKDYKTRCQAWADRTLARDEYTHFLAKSLTSVIAAAQGIFLLPVTDRARSELFNAISAYEKEFELRGQKPNDKAT